MLVKNCILTMQGILLRTVKLIIARLLASYIPGRQKQFGFFTVYFKDTMVFREAYETGKRGTLSDFFLLVIRRKRSFCSYLCKIKKTETHTFGQFSAGGFLMKKKLPFLRSYDVQSCYSHSDNNEQGQPEPVGFSFLKLHFGLEGFPPWHPKQSGYGTNRSAEKLGL